MNLPATPKTFTSVSRNLNAILLLDETYETVNNNRLNACLYPHQTTIVAAMLDIEQRRFVKLRDDAKLDKNRIIETSAMVLSEPFGSGKTVEILALIAERITPPAYPTFNNQHCLDLKPCNSDIRVKYISGSALLRPNLIIVGSSVLLQWAQAISDMTNFTYFVIADAHSMKKFIVKLNDGSIDAYDIVIMKNGTVTGNFNTSTQITTDGTAKRTDHHSMISVMRSLTQHRCWSRVVYDDFDTIGVPVKSQAINCIFTIYVSASTRSVLTPKILHVDYKSLPSLLNNMSVMLNNITDDKILFSTFIVRNKPTYTEQSTRITIIHCFKYVYNNPNDNYMRLLGAMGEDEANNIMEMLNGDAINTAANVLGIQTTSVADIFQRMLDKKYDTYMRNVKILKFIELTTSRIDDLEEHPRGKQHSVDKLKDIKKQIIACTTATISYKSVALQRLIDELHDTYTREKERDMLAITRVMDNIKEGECQICALPLEGFNVFIVRCCGMIVCDVCGIKGNQIAVGYEHKLRGSTLRGSCGNCKATIDPRRDLIFIDRSFDIEQLLTAVGDEKDETEEVPVEENDTAPPVSTNPKIMALIDIINNRVPAECTPVVLSTKNLLVGHHDCPQDKDTPKKVLLFAGYTETLMFIKKELRAANISCMQLAGTSQERNAIINKFRTEGVVLLINSQQNCAGLNLQFCTDIVHFHKSVDDNIDAQGNGRAQRIGRTHNLHIHYLCYHNESNKL